MKIVFFALCIIQAFAQTPVYSIDRTLGSASLNMMMPNGQKTLVTPLSEPIEDPSLTIDGASNVAYVASGQRVLQIDLNTGKTLGTLSVGGGGRLRSIAYDGILFKLFALFQSGEDIITMMDLTGGVVKTVFTMSTAGSVHRAYYGVDTHHYAFFFRPDDHTKPMMIYFIDTTTYTVYKSGNVQDGVNPNSFAIDYINNNCWIVWWNSTTMMFDLGIIHMNGTLQEVVAQTQYYAQAGAAAAIDIDNQYYYTTLYQGSTAFYAQWALGTGMLVVNPITWDEQALAWSEF